MIFFLSSKNIVWIKKSPRPKQFFAFLLFFFYLFFLSFFPAFFKTVLYSDKIELFHFLFSGFVHLSFCSFFLCILLSCNHLWTHVKARERFLTSCKSQTMSDWQKCMRKVENISKIGFSVSFCFFFFQANNLDNFLFCFVLFSLFFSFFINAFYQKIPFPPFFCEIPRKRKKKGK